MVKCFFLYPALVISVWKPTNQSFMTLKTDVSCCIYRERIFNAKTNQTVTASQREIKAASLRQLGLSLKSVRWRHDDRCPLLKSVWLIWPVGNEWCGLAQRWHIRTRRQSPHRSMASASHFQSGSRQAGMEEEMGKAESQFEQGKTAAGEGRICASGDVKGQDNRTKSFIF